MNNVIIKPISQFEVTAHENKYLKAQVSVARVYSPWPNLADIKSVNFVHFKIPKSVKQKN